MWRDELQAWNIVLESKSLVAIFQNIRYEGHPSLWFLLLWPFSLITSSPYVLQLLNLSLAALTAHIIIFKSPFSLWEKVLILFSYFKGISSILRTGWNTILTNHLSTTHRPPVGISRLTRGMLLLLWELHSKVFFQCLPFLFFIGINTLVPMLN
jgi:hypothetical protein